MRSVLVLDANTGAVVFEIGDAHTDAIRAIAYCPDGKHFVTGSKDCTLRLWNAETGTTLSKPFLGHFDSVNCVVFSLDGRQIVSGSDDMSVLKWDVQTCGVTSRFSGHVKFIISVTFSPDGKWAVSGSADETIRIWDLDKSRRRQGPSFSNNALPVVQGVSLDQVTLQSGWLMSQRGHRLLWIPPSYRKGLWWTPSATSTMIGMQTKISLESMAHGQAWTYCIVADDSG